MGFLMNNDCLRKYASSDAGFSTEAYYIIFGISYFTMVTRDTPIIGSTLKCTVGFGGIFTTTMNCGANLKKYDKIRIFSTSDTSVSQQYI